MISGMPVKFISLILRVPSSEQSHGSFPHASDFCCISAYCSILKLTSMYHHVFGQRASEQVSKPVSKQVSCALMCRNPSSIIVAYIASTLLVMLWLAFVIHVTLRQNEEDAEERPQAARVSEFLKARPQSSQLLNKPL